MYFEMFDMEIGEISEAEYYSEDWSVYHVATGEDGLAHTVVISSDKTRLAYFD